MINRNVKFWDAVAQHESVAPFVFMGTEKQSLAPLIECEKNIPCASTTGGILFVQMDHLGLIFEMHTMFLPDGWGREVAMFGACALNRVFEKAQMVVTYEQEDHWRSRPPKSHRWKSAGSFVDHGLPKRLKMWYLTKEDWLSSPVGKKTRCL